MPTLRDPPSCTAVNNRIQNREVPALIFALDAVLTPALIGTRTNNDNLKKCRKIWTQFHKKGFTKCTCKEDWIDHYLLPHFPGKRSLVQKSIMEYMCKLIPSIETYFIVPYRKQSEGKFKMKLKNDAWKLLKKDENKIILELNKFLKE